MQHFVHSEGGYGHTNEDVVEVRAHPHEYGVTLCALADGVGGQAGGGMAAYWAVQGALDCADEFDTKQLRAEATWISIAQTVDAMGQELESAGAGYTTLVCLGVMDDLLVGASCGDSAALLLDGRGGQRILTEDQRKNPPIGSGGAIPVAFSAPLGQSWQLLVMSEGVWKYLGWDVIISRAWEKRGLDLVLALRELSEARCNGKLWDDWSVAVLTN